MLAKFVAKVKKDHPKWTKSKVREEANRRVEQARSSDSTARVAPRREKSQKRFIPRHPPFRATELPSRGVMRRCRILQREHGLRVNAGCGYTPAQATTSDVPRNVVHTRGSCQVSAGLTAGQAALFTVDPQNMNPVGYLLGTAASIKSTPMGATPFDVIMGDNIGNTGSPYFGVVSAVGLGTFNTVDPVALVTGNTRNGQTYTADLADGITAQMTGGRVSATVANNLDATCTIRFGNFDETPGYGRAAPKVGPATTVGIMQGQSVVRRVALPSLTLNDLIQAGRLVPLAAANSHFFDATVTGTDSVFVNPMPNTLTNTAYVAASNAGSSYSQQKLSVGNPLSAIARNGCWFYVENNGAGATQVTITLTGDIAIALDTSDATNNGRLDRTQLFQHVSANTTNHPDAVAAKSVHPGLTGQGISASDATLDLQRKVSKHSKSSGVQVPVVQPQTLSSGEILPVHQPIKHDGLVMQNDVAAVPPAAVQAPLEEKGAPVKHDAAVMQEDPNPGDPIHDLLGGIGTVGSGLVQGLGGAAKAILHLL